MVSCGSWHLFHRKEKEMSENNSVSEKKEIRFNKGLLTAIPCLLFSLVCLYCSRTYPKLSADYMLVSASFFPTIVSIIAIAMSVIMLIAAIIKPERSEPLDEQQKRGLIRGILAILNCILYVLIFKPVGYIISSIICLFFMMLIFGNRKWVTMMIISIVFPILLYLCFFYLLQTNLPMGILSFIA